jgi:hypothetical protein
MPKPVKKARKKPTVALPVPPKPKRSSDPMKAAQAILAEHMGRVESLALVDFETQYRAHMAKLGAKGGKISGAKRMKNLSDRKRKEIAKKAAAARWGNRSPK